MTYSPDAATSTVFATLSFVCLVGSILIIAFEFVRGSQGDIYLPRARAQGHRTVPPPPPGAFQWIRHVLEISDEDFYKSVGLDGYVFLRYLRLCCKFTIISAVLGLLILAPAYFSCPGNDGVAGINLYTMANVEQNGKALWAPLIMSYVFSLVLLYLLHEEYGAFAHHRQGFLEHGDMDSSAQTSYSVLVENIPVEYRSTTKLAELFDSLFPDEVAEACISVGMHPLAKVVEERDICVAKAEEAVAAREADENKERPVLRLYKGIPIHSVCGCRAVTEVDALKYYQTEIAALDEKVSRYQIEARNAENADVLPPGTKISDSDINGDDDEESKAESSIGEDKRAEIRSAKKTKISKKSVAGTGFVTFKSRRAQAAACQIPILSQKYPQMKVFAAPEPSDIVWPNITTTLQYTKETAGLTKAIYWMGIGFWGLVLAFIATISNLEKLSEYLPFISDLDPVLYAAIAGVLPVIILALFMSYLPIFMEWISHYIEKRKTRSSITMEVFNWNFLYQITNVYLLMLAGSVAAAITDLIDDPSSILTTLGAALPSISVFFINFMLNELLVSIPLDMLRIGPLAVIKLYYYIFDEKSLTRRQLMEGPLAKEHLDYGQALPTQLYYVALVLTYWVIAPILTGVIAFVFLLSTITWKYKMLFVHVPEYEAGGVYWYGLYKYTMYALVASTVTMIGYMGLKEGAIQASAMFPLLYVIFRAWEYTEDMYKDISIHFAYSNAVEADCNKYSTADKVGKLLTEFHSDYYKQPYLGAPTVARLQPYRVDNIPLWNRSGALSVVYYNDISTQSDIEEHNEGGVNFGEAYGDHNYDSNAPLNEAHSRNPMHSTK